VGINVRKNLSAIVADRNGSVAVIASLFFTILVGVVALGVDLGSIFTDKRKAQSAADLAAIAAVSDITNADKAAAATISRNNLSKDASFKLQYGVYTADPSIPPEKRFVPSAASGANAARVMLNTTTPLFFAKMLTGSDKLEVNTTATAAQAAFASFAIGSRLLKVDGGLLNQILGGMLDSKLSLTAMDYQALVDAQIDLFNFMDAMATRLQITAGTYKDVLDTNAKASDVINAIADANRLKYGSMNTASKAATAIGQAMQGSTAKVRLSSLVDVGPYSTMPLGQKPKVGISASTLDLVSAAAQIANGEHQVEVALDAKVPGIASASLKLAVGERPKSTSWVTVGTAGASVHTAQTRLLLTVQVGGGGTASIVNIPIYIEIASGTAKLTALACGFPNVSTSTVTLGVTPGIVDAWIGDVSDSQFTNFTNAPNPPAATLINTPVLKVTGRAHATVSNLSATPTTFYYSDIQAQTKKTVGTKNFAASLLSKLISDTQFNINALGLGINLGGSVVSTAVAGILSDAVSPIDTLLASLLQTLGVGLGQADVWVLGIRCEGAVLVI
jgi:uncharacterized membrane protein